MNAENKASLASIYLPLRLAYGIVPLLAGLDKYFNLLADWKSYLPLFAADISPVSPETFMHMVGVIEAIAGLAVLLGLTRMGAYVVMAWLVAVAIVVASAGHLDIAVRDLVMAVGAYALSQTAALRGEQWIPSGSRMKGLEAHASATRQ